VAYIHQNEYYKAFTVWDELINGDVYPYGNYFHNVTGLNDYDNYLNTDAPGAFGYYSKFLDQPSVRRMIHVGNRPFQNGSVCEKHLLADFHVSFAEELSALLDSGLYRVLLYSGEAP
jgi:vitellogenic carboxypeptidase-like protein